MTLPVALAGTDVIGQAKTGTGKTLGFGLPLLERVTVPADVEAGRARPEDLTDAPQALVVVPTRELCTQVTNDLLTAGKVRNVRVVAIYGGRAYEPQVEALKKGVDVVVGTPGRLLDLAGQKKLDLSHVKALVLDEADEMLDLGFLPDVEKIINMLPAKRQTMLFSATMPGAVIGLARRYMNRPTHIRATAPDDEGATVANIKQFVYRGHSMDKPEMVARILQAEGRGLAMIFCRTKRTAADIAEQLQRRGFAAGAVHGDLGQGAREQALRAFRNGKVDVLVCTDVAARGIDVEGVTHVINYQSPEDEKTYLHRVGRTGRAGAKGTAITFVDWDDIPRWQLINKALQLDFHDPVETYSTSPHLFEDLGIPAGTKGVLPRAERTRAGLDAEELEDLGEPGGGRNRGRGGRSGRRDGGEASRPADRERSERTPRRRRRTRGGAPLDPAAQAPSGTTAPETPAVDAAEPVTAPRTPRRRRRTRGGAPAEQPATTATVEVAAPATESAEAAVTTAEGPGPLDAPETPAKPRRRRTRRSAETATTATATSVATAEPVTAPAVVTTAEPATTAVPEPESRTAPAEAPEPAAKPQRTRTRKAAATAPEETAADTAEAVEAKPRTRRTRKAVEPAEAPEVTAVETAEAAEAGPRTRRTRKAVEPAGAPVVTEAEAEAKPKRTRKATAAKAEAAADTAEGTEAKPTTRRTRKTAASPTAEIPAQATTEADAEAKPKRTRKATAAKAEAAADTAEGTEAKPTTRRTRKTAASPTAEAPAAAEAPEPEAKPKRTRKTAAAKATEPATETETEAKPKRTRKATAAKAEAAADTAEGTEAKPTTRRTRKTAASPTAEIPAQATTEADAEAKPKRTRKATAAKATEPAES
ncbi:DEAD/DEAH box helicase [Streptomyces glaucescens]|uniref:RNA helicase n=1 Tax=Streptomyces glaucescens TaxID=1907 RepID=A0A089Z3M0_STRGA|nr:DEAD/DEAH box helicase [Streptomyces glaucescens]AIS00381.1 ATP-dependent RNA helicase [Streptomyces glaucescens]